MIFFFGKLPKMNLQSPGCIFLAMQCTIFSFLSSPMYTHTHTHTHTSKHSLAVVYSEAGLNPVYLVITRCVVQDPTASQ